MASTTFEQQRKQAFDYVRELARGLPILLGTGYPVETPHCVLIDNNFSLTLYVYPEGDNGLSGIGKGRTCKTHHIEVG